MLPVCGLRQAKGLGYPSTDRIKVFDKHLWRTVGPSTSYPEWGGGAQRQPSIHKQEQDGPSLTTTSPGVYFSRAIASDARMPGCPMNNLHRGGE